MTNFLTHSRKEIYSFSDFQGYTGIGKLKQLDIAKNFLSTLSLIRQGGYLLDEFESLLLRFGYISKVVNACKVIEYNPDEALEKWSEIRWQ